MAGLYLFKVDVKQAISLMFIYCLSNLISANFKQSHNCHFYLVTFQSRLHELNYSTSGQCKLFSWRIRFLSNFSEFKYPNNAPYLIQIRFKFIFNSNLLTIEAFMDAKSIWQDMTHYEGHDQHAHTNAIASASVFEYLLKSCWWQMYYVYKSFVGINKYRLSMNNG